MQTKIILSEQDLKEAVDYYLRSRGMKISGVLRISSADGDHYGPAIFTVEADVETCEVRRVPPPDRDR